MIRHVLIAAVLLLLFNCKEQNTTKSKVLSADEIVQKAIDTAGGPLLKQSDIRFDFRDIHFRAVRDRGKFQLEREFKNSIFEIRDVLNNSGFERFQEGKTVSVVDSMVAKYSASVNSVHYFSVLPYGLDGKAVHKTYLDSIEISGQSYYKIKVTFSEDGGGEDYDDEYVYWINKKTYTTDYLAYTYKENDGSQGFRLRKAYNARMIKGIRFVDYLNYKPTNDTAVLEDLDRMFMEDQLELVSKIELKNIEVKMLN